MDNYLPGDQRLIEQIVRELKSQGIFDQFRRECISDVDTKPAYQNLRQRVESSVSSFLTKQTWSSEMNKNHVREMLRKNIYECGFLETGVERIVDQVVNPKITTVFLPKVEDVVYKFLGVQKPAKFESITANSVKLNTFHDLLPKDLEAVSPEVSDEKDGAKTPTHHIPMEEVESPPYEILTEKDAKIPQEENSVDSHSSNLSDHISQDSNHSIKQESLLSFNSSESRASLINSDKTCMKQEVVFSNQETDFISKAEFISDETMDTEMEDQIISNGSVDTNTFEENSAQDKDRREHSSEETKSKDQYDKKSSDNEKKRERHHSSSDKKSKLRSEKDKDKSKPEKNKKDESERKVEKEKYRIPRLSDKSKTEKESKSKDKEVRDKSKYEKDSKSDKEEKSEKDDKSEKDLKSDKNRKHSSEKERSRYDKNRKDSKNDKTHRERDEKDKKKRDSKYDKTKETKEDKNKEVKLRDEKVKEDKLKDDKSKEYGKDDKTKCEKSRDEKRSSTSSKSKEVGSGKDKIKEKDSSRRSNEEFSNKNKGNDFSTSKKDNSKHKRDEDKSKSVNRKNEKQDKEDKKRKRTSKDDHHSSKDKKNGRRSSDRDSDGPSNNRRAPSTPVKNEKCSSQNKTPQDSSSSTNVENSAEDSGTSEKHEEKSMDNKDKNCLLLVMQKIRLPKLASNMQEAMKIMKIRKQLKKLESMNKLKVDNDEMKKLLQDITDLSKDGIKEEKEKNPRVDDDSKIHNSLKETLNISDFISSSNISMAKWNALEAKFMEKLGSIDYNSYESPYIDEENLEDHHEKSIATKAEFDRNFIIESDIAQENMGINNKKEIGLLTEKAEGIDNESVEANHNILKFDKIEKTQLCSEIVSEEISTTKEYYDGAKMNGDIFEIDSTEVDYTENEKGNENNKLNICKNECEGEIVFNYFQSQDVKSQSEDCSISSTNNIDFEHLSDTGNEVYSTEGKDFGKKAIVLLKKHDLTEEIIKRKNGECDYFESLLKEKREIEAELMKTSIHSLEKGDNHNFDKNSGKPFEKNTLSNSKNTKQVNTQLNSKYESEEEFSGFEVQPGDIKRNLTILRCLIKCFEESIKEDIKEKNTRAVDFEKKNPRGRKRKQEEKCEATNNHLEMEVTKRIRKNTKSCTTSKNAATSLTKKENEEITADNKFSLPLSPAESEHEDKKGNVQSTNVTPKSRLRVTNNNVKQNGAVEISSYKNSGKSVELKNVKKQRYTDEDLYKPRMCLRRSGKKT